MDQVDMDRGRWLTMPFGWKTLDTPRQAKLADRFAIGAAQRRAASQGKIGQVKAEQPTTNRSDALYPVRSFSFRFALREQLGEPLLDCS